MMAPVINQKRMLAALACGFGLVMLLLSIAGFVTIRRSQMIQAAATTGLRDHLSDARTIDRFQIQQERMGKLLWDLLDSETADPVLIRRTDVLRHDFESIASAERQEQSRLNELRAVGLAFTEAARQVLHTTLASHRERLARVVEQKYDEFTALATQVVRAQAASSADLERQIQIQSGQLGTESFWLLAACLAISLFGAIVTIGVTARSFRTMRWQSEELNRVSWHMLESQETTARRFSHEMHDELGQSLTGVKALVRNMSGEGGKREECLRLLDESIRNVRELSLLLRPVILDDLGLDAALRWLSERFEERTRIEVVYHSNLRIRLSDQTETHFFRIAQEALTNVARHSEATRTRILLEQEGARVTLQIEDNGNGLMKHDSLNAPSLGMVGMRARARQLGGELEIETGGGDGVRIRVWAPLTTENSSADEETARAARE